MKNLIHLILVVIIGLNFTACEKLGPQETAKKFIECLNNEDYECAQRYATEETQQLLAFSTGIGALAEGMSNLAKGFGADEGQMNEMKKQMQHDYEFVKCELNPDNPEKAVCTFKDKTEGTEETFDLVKQGGKWKVHLDKEVQ